jgi:hypothetical protein
MIHEYRLVAQVFGTHNLFDLSPQVGGLLCGLSAR